MPVSCLLSFIHGLRRLISARSLTELTPGGGEGGTSRPSPMTAQILQHVRQTYSGAPSPQLYPMFVV